MILDNLAQLLWYAIPATSLVTIPLTWILINQKLGIRLIMATLFTISAVTVLSIISVLICFRNGMGPV